MSLPRPTRKLAEPITDSPVVPQPQQSAPKYRRRDFKPSDVFRFDPLPDITVQELAYVISILWVDVHFERFFSFPDKLQRHFRPRHE